MATKAAGKLNLKIPQQFSQTAHYFCNSFTSLIRTFYTGRCRGFTKSIPLLWSQAIALTPLYSIPLSSKIFCIPSSQVCQGLPLGLFPHVLACQVILGYLSFPIHTTYTVSMTNTQRTYSTLTDTVLSNGSITEQKIFCIIYYVPSIHNTHQDKMQ